MTNNIIKEAFQDDQLGRKLIAENFRNILLNTDSNVFSLIAPWGCGKTYFINNLIKIMEEGSINILYNAWESDFYNSPLIPLLVELLNKLENSYEMTELEEDIKFVKGIVKSICSKTSFQAGLNFGVINCSANIDLGKKMLESEYLELKNLIKEFRNKLKSIQEKLDKKIIIFIDELDRCNPMYTIKTLEAIKHFFGIPNIIFVLAVDKTQIENSVRTIFGVNIGEENGYLRKFIDVEFSLPKYTSKEFIAIHIVKLKEKLDCFYNSGRYYNHVAQKSLAEDVVKLCELIFVLVNLFNFSLRDIEKLFIRLSLSLEVLTDKDFLFIEPFILFNILALYNMDEFEKYTLGQTSEKLKIVHEQILPHWQGFFMNSYEASLHNASIKTHIPQKTQESNALGLKQFLGPRLSCVVSEQTKYLQDYPLKIKFINNFNFLD